MRSSEPLFRVPPFPAFPSLSRYVAVGSIQDAITRVCRSIDAREGISLVIGPPGTGKSLLANLIHESYRESREVVLLGDAPLTDPAALGRHLLHHLGIDRGGTTGASDWQLTLADHLTAPEAGDGGLLILVDEAQSLSSEVLEAIRMTTNIMRRGEPRVSAVLCGGPRLDETLADPALEPLTQRVATRCYLHPLSLDESRQYITEAIRGCGADPGETICEEAIAAVHHACSGVPRLINQLMTQAIDCAEASNQSVISEAVVDQAWAQLQQLPSPMIEEPGLAEPTAAVEFGTLEQPPEPSNWPEHSCPETGCAEPASAEAAGQTEPASAAAEPPGAEAERWVEPASDPEQPHQPPVSLAELDCAVSLPSVLFADELFGRFDEEEEVIVGAGVPPQPATNETPGAANISGDRLESTLHQEIIGIASQAAEAAGESTEDTEGDTEDTACSHGNDGPAERASGASQASEAGPEIEADEPLADRAAPVTSPVQPDSDPTPRPAAQPVIWLTETEEGELIRDDRDLLVIEDEVEPRPSSTPAANEEADDEEATVAVDFQAMLERMRNGS